ARHRLGRLRARHRLQRFSQRPALARTGQRPGRDQPRAGAGRRRPGAWLAHSRTVRMIKKLIGKLLGKPSAANGAAAVAKLPKGRRVEVPKERHGIDRSLVDERAIKVVDTLVAGGFEAYIVGGAVRDLLLGLRPKD